jgi:hypothetical protein
MRYVFKLDTLEYLLKGGKVSKKTSGLVKLAVLFGRNTGLGILALFLSDLSD